MKTLKEQTARVERMVKACEQGKKRIENFEAGFNSVGGSSTPFQMHVMVTLNAIKQDFEEALGEKNYTNNCGGQIEQRSD